MKSCPSPKHRRLLLRGTIVGLVIVAVSLLSARLIRLTNQQVNHATSPIGKKAELTLEPTKNILTERAAVLENSKDVKCWTSLKLLETFIASCPIEAETTHLKNAIVSNYVDQLWATADLASKGSSFISAPTIKSTVEQLLRSDTDQLWEYRISFPRDSNREVRLPFYDVENYASTVEPIRLLQNLANDLETKTPHRKNLTASAIDEACHFISLVNTLVLRRASQEAKEGQHSQIANEDMIKADQKISTSLGLAPFDPSRQLAAGVSSKVAGLDANESKQVMLKIVRQKIKSLETFNTNYSRDRLAEDFTPDLSAHETEWAKVPLTRSAAVDYKEIDLVDLAEFLYQAAARNGPANEPISGSQLLNAIQRIYPSITHFEHGTIHLYPEGRVIEALKVEEYEADAFRDSAWHWRAIEQMLLRDTMADLPAMDLYALEELSEFLSVFSVAYVKLAGQIFRNSLSEPTVESMVDRRAFKSARGMFAKASQAHVKSAQDQDKSIATDTADRPTMLDAADRTLAIQTMRSAYIESAFTDVTSNSGVDFLHDSSDLIREHRFAQHGKRPQDIPGYVSRAKRMREHDYKSTIPNHSLGIEGGGVAVADFDSDGLLDIYLVNGRSDRLYRNEGNLVFSDVTKRANLEQPTDVLREGRGAYFVDYDNDGDQDLFVTHVYSPSRLFENQGDGTFEDVTSQAGLSQESKMVSHSAVWFDFDNDGFLDVYIGNYGDWLGDELPLVQANSRNGEANLLYRNNGKGGFEDITMQTGAGDTGWAQAISHFDMNRDGWQDIYIANDFGQDVILVNDKGESFLSQVVGQGQYLHGMSVGFTDVNHDGREDVYVSNISTFSFASKYIQPDAKTKIAVSQRTTHGMRMMENNLFLVSTAKDYQERHHSYFDRSQQGSGWAWDADFFDFDNDGHEDLYIVNGREPNLSYADERNVLYKQTNGRFYDVSRNSGADFPSNARGAAHADFDMDGDLDLVVNNYHGKAIVLRNNLQRNNWIKIRLKGTQSNRDAIGARIVLWVNGRQYLRTVRGGSGFLSKEDCSLHFGLGDSRMADRVEIFWPSGRQFSAENLRANQPYSFEEE